MVINYSQTTGQTIGKFIGFTVLMTFESSNFTNKYTREPLSLLYRPYGLFSLQQFSLFWGIAFIVASILMILAIFKLFKKRCIREYALILITFHVGFAATLYMINLTLLEYALMIVIALCLSGTRRPLIWFTQAYTPCLIGSLMLAIYIFFTSRILHTSYFYPISFVFLCLKEAFVYCIAVSVVGCFARVSEPRIAGTSTTLLATIINLGHSLSSTLVLYIANRLPKRHAYSIKVGACLVLGLLWIGLMCRLMRRLNGLLIEEWHLKPFVPTSESFGTTSSPMNIIEGGVNVRATMAIPFSIY